MQPMGGEYWVRWIADKSHLLAGLGAPWSHQRLGRRSVHLHLDCCPQHRDSHIIKLVTFLRIIFAGKVNF